MKHWGNLYQPKLNWIRVCEWIAGTCQRSLFFCKMQQFPFECESKGHRRLTCYLFHNLQSKRYGTTRRDVWKETLLYKQMYAQSHYYNWSELKCT